MALQANKALFTSCFTHPKQCFARGKIVYGSIQFTQKSTSSKQGARRELSPWKRVTSFPSRRRGFYLFKPTWNLSILYSFSCLLQDGINQRSRNADWWGWQKGGITIGSTSTSLSRVNQPAPVMIDSYPFIAFRLVVWHRRHHDVELMGCALRTCRFERGKKRKKEEEGRTRGIYCQIRIYETLLWLETSNMYQIAISSILDGTSSAQ